MLELRLYVFRTMWYTIISGRMPVDTIRRTENRFTAEKKGKNMKVSRRFIAGVTGAAMLAALCAGCGAKKEPVTITIWNYYNGGQLETFNDMVQTFNDTVGKEQGITVECESQGSVNDLEVNVMNAAEGKVGAEELPNIFSGYADTAYALDHLGLVVDLNDYLTDAEKSAYIKGYLEEGDFDGSGEMKIFPTAKSTEILCLNDTDWQAFAQATGAAYDDLATVEGVTATAEKYYDWTDAQTAAPDDGRALFGRDAMANYMLIGAKELGCTIFDVQDGKMTLHFDKDVIRKLWDNYYVPFVKGYFEATGHFRSDDIKTGTILAYVGSNSSATFFPTDVLTSDTDSHEITLKVLPNPHFEGSAPISVQQGAGMVVTKGDEAEIKASVTFLKWFTAPENNIAFSVGSGYLPVTYEANQEKKLLSSGVEMTKAVQDVLSMAIKTVNEDEMYTTRAFAAGKDARKVLEYAMSDLAVADRDTVEQRIAAGQSAEQAEAEFLSDAYFDGWYQDTLTQLQAFEG